MKCIKAFVFFVTLIAVLSVSPVEAQTTADCDNPPGVTAPWRTTSINQCSNGDVQAPAATNSGDDSVRVEAPSGHLIFTNIDFILDAPFTAATVFRIEDGAKFDATGSTFTTSGQNYDFESNGIVSIEDSTFSSSISSPVFKGETNITNTAFQRNVFLSSTNSDSFNINNIEKIMPFNI